MICIWWWYIVCPRSFRFDVRRFSSEKGNHTIIPGKCINIFVGFLIVIEKHLPFGTRRTQGSGAGASNHVLTLSQVCAHRIQWDTIYSSLSVMDWLVRVGVTGTSISWFRSLPTRKRTLANAKAHRATHFRAKNLEPLSPSKVENICIFRVGGEVYVCIYILTYIFLHINPISGYLVENAELSLVDAGKVFGWMANKCCLHITNGSPPPSVAQHYCLLLFAHYIHVTGNSSSKCSYLVFSCVSLVELDQ